MAVEFETVAGCVVSEELRERAKGYNEPMQQEINRRFGAGALENLDEEARLQYQQQLEIGRKVKP